MAEEKINMEDTKEWILVPESELRFEVDAEKIMTVVLKEGKAEVFGVEMAKNREYRFTATKVAVFTWEGATLATAGEALVAYASEETPMEAYVNTHAHLEARRLRALGVVAGGVAVGAAAAADKKPRGPVVVVAGPVDSGKSSMCRMLLAYAARLGRRPLFADLDVGQGSITVPGCVAAAAIDQQSLSVEEGLEVAAPLAYWYGHANLAENPELYKALVRRLAAAVDQRRQNDPEAAAAGLVVNTAGWVEGLGYELLLDACKALGADTVLVMGADRLYAQLRSDLPAPGAAAAGGGAGGAGCTVVKLPRSGGVVTRDTKFRRATRKARVREYFYGPPAAGRPGRGLSPAMVEYAWARLGVYRVGGDKVSAAMLPVGQRSALDPLRAERVPVLTQELLHAVLAVCHPVIADDGTVVFGRDDGPSPQEGGEGGGGAGEEGGEAARQARDDQLGRALVQTNVAGFVYVTELDLERQKITFLAPCAGALPSFFLLTGSIKWME